MILHDHAKVRYISVSTYIGNAYSVQYDGKLTGHVMRRSHGWGYLPLGGNSDSGWIVGFNTRKDAADHLISAFSPSASWLV